MDDRAPTTSPQLLAANRRLHKLRREMQAKRKASIGAPWDLADTAPAEEIAALPPHLGWGSEALTANLRRRHGPIQSEPVDERESPVPASGTDEGQSTGEGGSENEAGKVENCGNPYSAQPAPQQCEKEWVKLYPDIGLGMLREALTAPGRLWLLLRYLDIEGRGTLRIDITQQNLTQKSSRLRLCGKRQLRNLLRDGEGVFWERDKTHIWLRAAGKVAYALGVERLSGKPVALPLEALLNGIGGFRAHLYTAFHSGRTKETADGSQAMPIARSTLAELSGVGESSQRAYESRVDIEIQANFAIGDERTKEGQEDHAWRQGQALFTLKDYRGYQGKKGRTYLAWQLPNSYIGEHAHRPRGRQRRINRKLKDLVIKGMPGNVERRNEARRLKKSYFPTKERAAKVHERNSERALYWRRHQTRNGSFELWQWLERRQQ
jgi:hypothetical protein